MVDDGSVDKSTAIAKDYVSRFPDKIFYVEHNDHVNKAAAATRNLGFHKSSGKLIALLDADDIWTPDKLENQVEIFTRFPEVKMVCEASMYWYSWNNAKVSDKVVQIGVEPDKVYNPPELVVKLYPLSNGEAPCPSGIMITSSALNLHNGFEESFIGKYQVYEDQAFLSKIYLNEPVYISSACNNYYRQRSNSVMDTTMSLGHYDIARKFYLEWLKKYLQEHKIKNRAIHFLLWKAQLNYTSPTFYKIVNKIEKIIKSDSKT